MLMAESTHLHKGAICERYPTKPMAHVNLAHVLDWLNHVTLVVHNDGNIPFVYDNTKYVW